MPCKLPHEGAPRTYTLLAVWCLPRVQTRRRSCNLTHLRWLGSHAMHVPIPGCLAWQIKWAFEAPCCMPEQTQKQFVFALAGLFELFHGDGGCNARPGGRVVASPYARKLARDAGVDVAKAKGTGPGGRVVAADVQQLIESGGGAEAESAPAPDAQAAVRGPGLLC